jgi:hypothetical protein
MFLMSAIICIEFCKLNLHKSEFKLRNIKNYEKTGTERGKGKLSRYKPWRRLGGGRKSSYSFLTSALDGGEWSASRHGRPLPPGKRPPVSIGQESEWAPEPVWTLGLEEKSPAPAGDYIRVKTKNIKGCLSNSKVTKPEL